MISQQLGDFMGYHGPDNRLPCLFGYASLIGVVLTPRVMWWGDTMLAMPPFSLHPWKFCFTPILGRIWTYFNRFLGSIASVYSYMNYVGYCAIVWYHMTWYPYSCCERDFCTHLLDPWFALDKHISPSGNLNQFNITMEKYTCLGNF